MHFEILEKRSQNSITFYDAINTKTKSFYDAINTKTKSTDY